MSNSSVDARDEAGIVLSEREQNALTTLKFSRRYRLAITNICRNLVKDNYLNSVRLKYIEQALWLNHVNDLRRLLIKNPFEIFNDGSDDNSVLAIAEQLEAIILEEPRYLQESNRDSLEPSEAFRALEQKLFSTFLVKAEQESQSQIRLYRTLCLTTDVREPFEWYPRTRLMRRKIIYHGGPTNSGKTYHALQRLRQADPQLGGGLYAGPLRLLALEVYEQLNRQGVYTSLLTGQEQKVVPLATHIACTLEMVNLDRDYDVAVIDEIQMISNEQRGYAWTRFEFESLRYWIVFF
jgi:hypothetical protein